MTGYLSTLGASVSWSPCYLLALEGLTAHIGQDGAISLGYSPRWMKWQFNSRKPQRTCNLIASSEMSYVHPSFTQISTSKHEKPALPTISRRKETRIDVNLRTSGP